jgi:hypothetical protein
MSSGAAPPTQTTETPKVSATVSVKPEHVTYGILGSLPMLLFSLGAAKLSYDKFQSFGWAILAFIFSGIYYPYYAFFISVAAPPAMVAAGRRIHKW